MREGNSTGPGGSERDGRLPSGSELDDSELPGVPDQRTLALINIYLVHTSKMLNNFASTCEQRIHATHSRILEIDTRLRLLEAKVDSAAASTEEAATPAIEGTDDPQGPSSSSLQPLDVAGSIDNRVNEVSPSRVELPESVAPSVHGDSDSVEEIDLDCDARPHTSRTASSLRNPKERVEDYVATQRRDALSRRSAESGSLPEESVPIQLPPLAEFPGLNISPTVSTDFGSNHGLLGPRP